MPRASFVAVVALLLVQVYAAGPLQPGQANDRTPRGGAVALFDFHEIIIQADLRAIGVKNPYKDLELAVEVSPAGDAAKPVHVRGFYFGASQYRARFPALRAGQHQYAATLSRPEEAGAGLTFRGSFTVAGKPRGRNRGPAAVSEKNPIWFVDGTGAPLLLIGAWSHGSLDANIISGTGGGRWRDTSAENFNRYADLAIQNGFLARDGAPTPKYFKAIDALMDALSAGRTNWIVVTADHMAWGFQTASNWKGLRAGSFDDPYSYDPNAGLIWDHALAAARDRGVYVKINCQEFCQGNYGQHPFQHLPGVDLTGQNEHPDDMTTVPAARDAWRRWVSYLASRYGAFTNVMFQMGNEPPGDGCRLGPAKWGEFDTFTREAIRAAAARPVLYSSGAPVGGGVHQGDFHTFHPTHQVYAASSFYRAAKDRPFHNEEIKAYAGKDLPGFLNGSRYVKFASFIGGGHGSALVMWNWKPGMAEYMQSSVALHNFVEPVLPKLLDLRPDESFIKQAPAEFCRGLAGGGEYLVYMQKIDPARKDRIEPLPGKLVLSLPDGEAQAAWFDPIAGRYLPARKIAVKDGTVELTPPAEFRDDFALRVSVSGQQRMMND